MSTFTHFLRYAEYDVTDDRPSVHSTALCMIRHVPERMWLSFIYRYIWHPLLPLWMLQVCGQVFKCSKVFQIYPGASYGDARKRVTNKMLQKSFKDSVLKHQFNLWTSGIWDLHPPEDDKSVSMIYDFLFKRFLSFSFYISWELEDPIILLNEQVKLRGIIRMENLLGILTRQTGPCTYERGLIVYSSYVWIIIFCR